MCGPFWPRRLGEEGCVPTRSLSPGGCELSGVIGGALRGRGVPRGGGFAPCLNPEAGADGSSAEARPDLRALVFPQEPRSVMLGAQSFKTRPLRGCQGPALPWANSHELGGSQGGWVGGRFTG